MYRDGRGDEAGRDGVGVAFAVGGVHEPGFSCLPDTRHLIICPIHLVWMRWHFRYRNPAWYLARFRKQQGNFAHLLDANDFHYSTSQ